MTRLELYRAEVSWDASHALLSERYLLIRDAT